MKEAVVFGAGSVGRGFVGQLLCRAGFHVTFVDVVPDLVRTLAAVGSYPHVTVSNLGSERTVVGPVTALDAHDTSGVVAAVVAADLVATAVGAGVLPQLAPALAAAVAQRIELGRPPLNVLLCENLHNAADVVRALIDRELPNVSPATLNENLGLIETSIGRMIPVPDPETLAIEPTIIFAEPYRQLPYDGAAVRGAPLDVPGLVAPPGLPFAFFAERKLYVHNLGHTLTAYLGECSGAPKIADAIELPLVRYLVRAAMVESALALSLTYRQPLAPLLEHVDDLIHRFGNHALGDTVERVGRDPVRKTAPGDRFLGPFAMATRLKSPSRHLSLAVALGGDALRRHLCWTPAQVRAQLTDGLRSADLTEEQLHLLDRQLDTLAEGFDLDEQIELIDQTFEPARVL